MSLTIDLASEPTKLDKIIDEFNKKNGIVYELVARSDDGEVIAKYTSLIDASDVAGFAGLLDEKIFELALNESEGSYE